MTRCAALVAILVGVTAASPPAPAIITGVVRDPATRLPIAGAVVTVNGDADSAITDAAGRYSIRRPTQTHVSLGVKRIGYLTLAVPMIQLGADTLHFDADLHSNPVKLLSANGQAAKPLTLIRYSPDTLVLGIGDSVFYRGGKMPADSTIESVEVIKRRTARVVAYGPAGEAGGVIRVVMKKARGFGFGD
jgi:hypothetical protein